jgi:predicted deacylase
MYLTPGPKVNQTVEITRKTRAGITRGARAGSTVIFTLVALSIVLTGCEPSPASQALKPPPIRHTDSATAAPVSLQPPAAEPIETPAAPAAVPDTPLTADTNTDSDMEIDIAVPDAAEISAAIVPADGKPAFELLGESVAPGTSQRLHWSAGQIFEGVSNESPVLVVNGTGEGPTMCLTAAIHGDELNGIEMVRRVLHDLDPAKLNGVVIGIPIVNLQGFRRGSRYLPDRRDLNRYFPGNADGSSAARIANSLFKNVIRHCDALVDLHTGSFYRTNLPQLRADLRYPEIRELTQGFGGMPVLHSEAAPGTLRRAAADAGIPTVTLEAGEPLRLQSAKVAQGVTGIFKLLNTLKMVNRVQLLAQPEPVFYESTWVRADHGGILFTVVRLGQVVATGDVLGTVTDPITNEQNLIYSPEKGRVLGMALNQVVMPGFAAFRIGIETDGLPENSSVASLPRGMAPGPPPLSRVPSTDAADEINDFDQTEEASE